ncbi:hypothetical protein DSECCO2_479040 [anaerobic digester metagenome]
MNPGFIFHLTVNVFPGNIHDNLLVSSGCPISEVHQFDFPAFCFTELRVHPVKVTRKNAGFVATGAGTDFNHGIFAVLRIGRNQHQADVFFHRVAGFGERIQFFLGHRPEFLVLLVV